MLQTLFRAASRNLSCFAGNFSKIWPKCCDMKFSTHIEGWISIHTIYVHWGVHFFLCRCTYIMCNTNILTNSMQYSPSWEANRFSASQGIPPHFMEPEGSLSRLQQPASCPYTELDQSSPCPHPTLWISTLILSSHLKSMYVTSTNLRWKQITLVNKILAHERFIVFLT